MNYKQKLDVLKFIRKYTRTNAFIEKAWDWIEDNILSSNQQINHFYIMNNSKSI